MQRSTAHVALGRAIRERRRALGLSQQALGRRSGLHRTYLGGVERGTRNPSLANLLKIAAALGEPLSELVARADEPSRRG